MRGIFVENRRVQLVEIEQVRQPVRAFPRPSLLYLSRLFLISTLFFVCNLVNVEGQRPRGAGNRAHGSATRQATAATEQPASTGLPQLVVQEGHTGEIAAIAFSPDGRYLATGGQDGVINLWDIARGSLLRTFRSFEYDIASVRFSSDGLSLTATERKYGGVKVFNLTNGRDLLKSSGRFIDFSPDGRLLAAESGLRAVSIHSADTGKLICRAVGAFGGFSPDGKTVALQVGRNVSLVSTSTGRLIRSFLGRFIGFNARGDAILTDLIGTVSMWDLASGKESRTFLGQYLNFADDGRIVVTTSLSGSTGSLNGVGAPEIVGLWDIETGKLQGGLEHPPLMTASYVDSRKISHAEFAHGTDRGLILVTTTNNEGTEKLSEVWNAQTGKQLFGPQGEEIIGLSFDGKTVILRQEIKVKDQTSYAFRLRELTTGNLLASSSSEDFDSLSDDSRYLLCSEHKLIKQPGADKPDSEEITFKLRSAANGDLLFSSADQKGFSRADFSPDGSELVLTDGPIIRVWDIANQRQLAIFKGRSGTNGPVSISPDRKIIAYMSVSDTTTVRLVDLNTGTQLTGLEGEYQQLEPLVYSADSSEIGSTDLEGDSGTPKALIWDAQSGKLIRTAQNQEFVAFSSDGKYFTTAEAKVVEDISQIQQINLWDNQTGALVHNFSGVDAAFSPDAKLLAIRSLDSSISVDLWDLQAGRMAAQFKSTKAGASFDGSPIARPRPEIAFSPDGKTVAAWGNGVVGDRPLELWDVKTGRMTHRFAEAPYQVAFSPDSSHMAFTDIGGNAFNEEYLYTASGRLVMGGVAPEATADYYRLPAFSPDGRLIATGGRTGRIRILDKQTGRLVRSFSDPGSAIGQLTFLNNNVLVTSANSDGTVKFWSIETGQLLATILSFDRSDWLVVAPDGLFDGSPAAYHRFLWRFANNTFDTSPIEIFFNEFYYPGLLGEILAGEQPKATRTIAQLDRRPPSVKLTLPETETGPAAARAGANQPVIDTRTIKVKIDISSAPAGVQDVRLFRNGSLVKLWRGNLLADGAATVSLEAIVPIVAGPNTFTAYAFNRDDIKSSDSTLTVTGGETLRRDGTVYILAVGIDHYANSAFDLKFAAADSLSFAQELGRQQTMLGNGSRVELVPLVDGEATRSNILHALARLAGQEAGPLPGGLPAALTKLQPAQPEDSVIIYFAGHGIADGSQFYIVPHDLGYAGERDLIDQMALKSILTHSLSDQDLENAFEKIDAGRMLLVIDACESGQALESQEKRRGPMNSKGLAQIAYEKGVYVLTAAQSYQAALEATQLQHGYLTYALVEDGIKQGKAFANRKGEPLTARAWLDYAAARVPQMQQAKLSETRQLTHKVAFVSGEEKLTNPDQRNVQRPRIFYRRELEAQPFIVARPTER